MYGIENFEIIILIAVTFRDSEVAVHYVTLIRGKFQSNN